MTGGSERTGASVVSDGKNIDETGIQDIKKSLSRTLPCYNHDQYINYPSRVRSGWVTYALARIDNMLTDPEYLVFEKSGNLLCCRVSRWDTEHFGFGMAMISLPLTQTDDCMIVAKLLKKCLRELRAMGVRFASARISGDDSESIHAFEQAGFRYYETIIWPVLRLDGSDGVCSTDIRLMIEDDLERVIDIASRHQFKRSHYHADRGFDPKKVDEMHAKWIRTSWQNREPVAVIERESRVAGYFAFRMDNALSSALGYKYARMRSLTLDPIFRGTGLGKRLFGGTISLMRGMGAEMVDSGYASKNHKSARLHVQRGFESVHEEVTLHLWLGAGK